MAETLLAILLATSSANDNTIAFRWPASPKALPRLARQRPPSPLNIVHADAPYRAATYSETSTDNLCKTTFPHLAGDRFDYEWQRPSIKRDRSHSFASSGRSSSGGRHSPVHQRSDRGPIIGDTDIYEYENVFGFDVGLLAHFLCPMIDNCHQKFELIVDDLVFIGHPVCVGAKGAWNFKGESCVKDEKNGEQTGEEAKDGDISPVVSIVDNTPGSMLKLFHVVFVLDLPDPASSASGNLNKYFDTVYQNVAFPLTAVLYSEQVLHKYVEHEWDLLVKLKEDYISNGDPYDDYISECLKKSSLARTFEHVYTSIRSNSLARLTISNVSLDLQLPPYLDCLLHVESRDPSDASSHAPLWSAYGYEVDEDERLSEYAPWGPELSFGWKLPALTPWKALLLLDIDPKDVQNDPLQNLNRPGLTPDEREIAEGISRFLETASVFVSLSEMATGLDWDLQKQVYPTVRYLVQRRRAKVVDLIRSSLKSIFTVSSRIDTSISQLTTQFSEAFPTLPPLPVILARISGTPNNFFNTVVQSKENIPIYKNVIVWLLKRDLLIMLHMRFRITATPTLKQLVAATRKARHEDRRRRRRLSSLSPMPRGRRRKSSGSPLGEGISRSRSTLRSQSVLLERAEEAVEDESGDEPILSPRPPLTGFRENDVRIRHSFRSPPMLERWGPGSLLTEHRQRRFSDMSPASKMKRRLLFDQEEDEQEDPGESESESDSDDPEDLKVSSLISNPERATPKERRWLRGMTIGKNPAVAKRFEKIYRYFDGKVTGDEILYKADISRKDLREVLHQFEEHITTFLHP